MRSVVLAPRLLLTSALLPAVLAAALVQGCCCSSCGGCGSVAPQGGGATPYARCAVMDPPPARAARVGDLTLRIEGRELAITGLPDTFPVAIARGAAPGRDPIAPALDAIEEHGARLLLVLGSLGDDEASVGATVAALAGLGRPVLIVEGGRDDPSLVSAAIGALEGDARDRVIDVSALRRVRLGALVLVPVPGAPGGRYARTDATCGVGEDDLEAIADELGEAGEERRMLLSWAAPAGARAALGIEGADAGDPAIAELARAIGARGGLHAWPEAHAGEILEGHAVAPAIAGPAVVRADGSGAPSGVLGVTLGPDGVVGPASLSGEGAAPAPGPGAAPAAP